MSAIETPFVGRQGTTEVFECKTVEPGEVVHLEWEKAGQDGSGSEQSRFNATD